MRIAVGQLWQETNTFNPLVTTREEFEQFGVCRGDEFIARMESTNEPGGFIQTLRAWPERPEIAGLVRLPAWPSGPATVETYEWLCFELMRSLLAARPFDGVLLALHGAMAAEFHPDVEGDVLQAVRQLVGPQVPIVATLDLHANVTEEMVAAADALVLYHTMPHVDLFETGERAAHVLRRILVDGVRPCTAFQKIPAVVPAERSSTEAASGVAVDRKRRLQALEARPGVLAAGVAPVQPWLDVPQLGASVVVTGDVRHADECVAACAAEAREFWLRRHEYLPELTPIEAAVQAALDLPAGLCVLSDPADSTTSGAPGDSVWLLRELVRHAWRGPVLVPLVAPEIVAKAESLGVGATSEFALGGVRDTRFGTQIPFAATVERLFEASFVMSGHLGRNLSIDMGRSAVLRQGEVHVLVTSRSGPHFAPEFFRAGGFDPFAAAVLVAKSPCGFRACYEGRAQRIVSVSAPGCAPSNFWEYAYEHRPRPLWPWDEIGDWQPAPKLVTRGKA